MLSCEIKMQIFHDTQDGHDNYGATTLSRPKKASPDFRYTTMAYLGEHHPRLRKH